MAANDFDTLEGKLEVVSRPATLCYGKPWDFVRSLIKILRVTFPVNRNNKFIVEGHETPGTDDIDTLWARFDPSRNPIGWFAFVKGQWRRFYTPVPGELRWVVGDSNTPPSGWVAITSTGSGVDQAILDELKSQYVEISSGRYSYYAVRYVGY